MKKKTYLLTIRGMHCNSCALTIDMDIEELSGVEKVSTNYAKSQTIVTFDSSRVSCAAIKKIITKNGYTVEREEEQK